MKGRDAEIHDTLTEDGVIWRDMEWSEQAKCFIAGEEVTPMAVRTYMRLETALKYPHHKEEIEQAGVDKLVQLGPMGKDCLAKHYGKLQDGKDGKEIKPLPA